MGTRVRFSFCGIAGVCLLALGFLVSCSLQSSRSATKKSEARRTSYRIGLMTSTGSQSVDDVLAKTRLVSIYGEARGETGGRIVHVTYSDNFSHDHEATVSKLLALAEDSTIKAIVVSQAVPGVSKAFGIIKSKRPDVLLFAGEPLEPVEMLQESADIVVSQDYLFGGYAVPWVAERMGARTLVHVSFPRHMSYPGLRVRRTVMRAACTDLGLSFAHEEAPDPVDGVSDGELEDFFHKTIVKWIKKYGKETLFYCTNDAHNRPLISALLKYGGMLIGATIFDYADALGVHYAELEDVYKIREKVEKSLVAFGAEGRFGLNLNAQAFTVTMGFVEYARKIIDGEPRKDDMREALAESFDLFTRDAHWRIAPYLRLKTHEIVPNHVLVYTDTYVLGKFTLPVTNQVLPEGYWALTAKE
ncbi:DUF3798 domain-containing protein [Treponema pallidum]|uniref:Probable lipoprotein n=1 Tax=Treponema pallidum subsp. pertenue (strain Gauthier) TaxID=491080 RepID=A0AAU8PXA4_TREPG|nr:DUF3798 domain-containing protein [Treponema pallidum]AEZ59261.1 probable lipoprotein [Treponema pallidum subsp. pertenue str. Gauthier]